MGKPGSTCPDCKADMQPIKLLDATAPGWDHGGVQHVEPSSAAPDARASAFLGRIPRLGVVRGVICPECGRIMLYGVERASPDPQSR